MRGARWPAGRIAQSRGLAERPYQSERRQPRAVRGARPGLCRPIGRRHLRRDRRRHDAAGVATGTPYFTREFYAAASRQLAEDGIFAQRFPYVDFGPWPVRSMLATLKSVFSQVAAIEAGGGDFVLLATNSPKGLNRPDLLKRFQSPQVGRAFSHVGWDWSVALNLGAYWGEKCNALAEGAAINTASNGLFAYRLPQETMRWGAKREELAEVLNPHAGRIAEWPNADGNDPEFIRRLSDVLRQRS